MMTKSFPPADALISKLQEIDYIGALNSFMNWVEIICYFVFAQSKAARKLWEQYGMTERTILAAQYTKLGAQIVYTWSRDVAAPKVEQTLQRVIYVVELVTSTQYTTLM